jgi:hypothetical protein
VANVLLQSKEGTQRDRAVVAQSGHQVGATAFSRQLAIDPLYNRSGSFRVELDEAWNCPYVPHGGLISAVAARAMQTEIGKPDQRLRTMTAMFAAPVLAGPAEIDVTVLRSGRSSSNCSATLRSEGKTAGLSAVAFFGAPRPALEFVDLTMPDVPLPETCVSVRDSSLQLGNFWHQVDERRALGHERDEQYIPTTSECAFWYRFDEPPMLTDGTLDPLAVLTLCDTMPMAIYERMGPSDSEWEVVSIDLTVHLLAEAHSEWILGVNRARYAGDGYVSVENELWDPECGLVAYATEAQVVQFSSPPATTV